MVYSQHVIIFGINILITEFIKHGIFEIFDKIS